MQFENDLCTCAKVEPNTTQNIVMANPVMIPNSQFKATLGKICQRKIIPTQSRLPSWRCGFSTNRCFLLHILCFFRKEITKVEIKICQYAMNLFKYFN